ncbi:SdrD B-like domain-containing protein [Lysinibacter cavernae]|uniref:SD-repeat containing protein B domain-containing protein n=1 Tax=Lysinibacter cavernae TaxID=1640652 RepID=A0A7X5R094_9MICO|nr:SdrD B-like domain-containing protein [Lysinibacter cavernae]NIH53253.1 hypothetical protein [Lysinibacter cavernae]
MGNQKTRLNRNGEHRRYLGSTLATVVSAALITSMLTVSPSMLASAVNNPAGSSPRSVVNPGEVSEGVHGIVWIDLNGNGSQDDNILGSTESFGDPSVAGAGLESAGRGGVKIDLLGSTGNIVASTTTGDTGEYAFTAVADGSYTVRAVSPSQNYRWIMPSTSHSDLVGQAEAPPTLHTAIAPVTVAGGTSAAVNGGLRPIPQLSLGLASSDTSLPNGGGIVTGSGTLPDVNNICPTAEPGNDCSLYDNRVATNDITSIAYTIGATNLQKGVDDKLLPVGDVILEVLLKATDGAKVNFQVSGAAQVPTLCRIDRSVKSQILVEANGDQRLICNVGPIDTGSARPFGINILTTGESPNDSSFETSAIAYSASNDALPSKQYDIDPVHVSAAPRFNLVKRHGDQDPQGGLQVVSGVYKLTNPVTGLVEDSLLVTYSAVIEGYGGKKGQQSIGDSFEFRDLIDPELAKYGAAPAPGYCGALNDSYSKSWMLPGAVAAGVARGDNQLQSSDFACDSAADASGSFGVKVTGADTTLASVPTTSMDRTNSMGAHALASVGRVTVAYPLSALMKANKAKNPALNGWKDGDPLVTGLYSVTNCYTDFEPTSPGGVSNFGGGNEPGWDGNTASGDNCVTHDLDVRASGALVKAYGKIPASGDPLTVHVNGTPSPDYKNTEEIIPTGLSGWLLGDGLTTGGEEMYTYLNTTNSTGTIPVANAQVCDVWDNSVQTLAPFSGGPSAGMLASLSLATPGGAPTKHAFDPASEGITVEYGKLTAGGSWGNPLMQTYDSTTARYTGDWTAQRGIAQDCGTSAATAGDLIFSTDPVADGWNLEDIAIIRMTPKNNQLDAFTSLMLRAKLVTRVNFYGGPNDGQAIESGVILANFTGSRANGGYKNPSTYDPNTHAGPSARGDRLAFQSVALGITKTANQDASGDDNLNTTNAGDPFTWTISPYVSSTVPSAQARDLTVVDTLPASLRFEPACTVTPDGVSGPILGTNAKGLTTLTWSYGDRAASENLPKIDVCTSGSMFVASGSELINTVDVLADNVIYKKQFHEATRGVIMYAPEGLQVEMDVDQRINTTDQTQQWKLNWGNTASGAKIMPTDSIFVFPKTGDNVAGYESARHTYGSDYSGSLKLAEIPAKPVATGSMTGELAGDWYYTSAAAETVSDLANDASNALSGGSTRWCTEADFGTTGCPANIGEVTAIRFIQTDSLEAQTLVSATVKLAAQDNSAADLYVGMFAVWSETYATQPVVSNEPYTQVLGFSIGDLIWQDNDENGVYDPAIDTGAPAGVTVEVVRVVNGTETVVETVTTDANGRWVANKLDTGDYYVRVSADQFAEGGPLYGFSASPHGVQSDPNTNLNEDVDNNNEELPDGGLRSAGLLNLSADIDPPNVTGNGPLGDDVAGVITNPLLSDDFTNLTLDLAVEATGGIVITKQLEGAGVDAFAYGDTLTFAVACEVRGRTIPVDDVELTVPDGATSVTSAPITNLPLGTTCTVTETDKGKADDNAAAATVTVVKKAADASVPENTVVASLTNYYSAGALSISKRAEGPAEALAQVKDDVFSILVTCQVPETLANGDTVISTLYSGTVKIKIDQNKRMIDDVGNRTKLPLGTHCFATETDAGTAVAHTVDYGSYDQAVVVTEGTPESLQQLSITAVNTFETAVVPPVDPEGPGAKETPGAPGNPSDGSNAGSAQPSRLQLTGTGDSWPILILGIGAVMMGLVLGLRRKYNNR